jgi:hypothetical protein
MRIVSILQALLTPTIAAITTYIAIQQYKGNRLRLKMDRYERRLRVYQEVVKMLKIGSNGKPEWSEIIDFSSQTAEGDFLFGPEIREYLNDIVTRATKLRSAHFEYRDINSPGPVPAHYDHNKVVEEMGSQQQWFTDQIVNSLVKSKFKKYLNIS